MTALRRAAVLCPIVEHGGHDHLLFTKRPETLGRHAGQIGPSTGVDRSPARNMARISLAGIGRAMK